MAPPKGWNVVTIHRLHESLRRAGGTEARRDAVIKCIRDWWNAPDIARARASQQVTARDAAIEACEFSASFGGEYLNHIIARARISPSAFEGLKRWARAEALDGRSAPAEVLAVLLSPSGAPKPRGRPYSKPPSIWNTAQQTVAIVHAVTKLTQFISTSTTKADARDFDSPFVIISEATRQDAGTVRRAWRDRGK